MSSSQYTFTYILKKHASRTPKKRGIFLHLIAHKNARRNTLRENVEKSTVSIVVDRVEYK
jgi:hypothetical protein